MRRYKSATTLGKVFVWMTLLLIVAFAAIYAMNVRDALAMDPTSYNCTEDSMMKQICADPFGSSVIWSVLGFGIYCWPLILGWMLIGSIILIRRDNLKK